MFSFAAQEITTSLVASNNTSLLALSSVYQSPSLVWLGFLLRVSQAKSKVLAGLSSVFSYGKQKQREWAACPS